MSDVPYLKQVSRVKHRILSGYLLVWAEILGSSHNPLLYVDCFAGGGQYVDENDNPLPGSPLIAVQLAQEYSSKHPGRSIRLKFVEKDGATAQQLRDTLTGHGVAGDEVQNLVAEEDAHDFVGQLNAMVRGLGPTERLVPTFFFVDPYGFPITVPYIKGLLALGKTEVFLNLMWHSINRHLDNPKMRPIVDKMFGQQAWHEESFMGLAGYRRERAFINYFAKQVGARYHVYLPVPFSPEDRVQGKGKRNKFYLIHFSGHPKAALIMNERDHGQRQGRPRRASVQSAGVRETT